MNFSKYLGLFLVLMGITDLLFTKISHGDAPLLIGLFIIFISKDKKEDERAVSFKTSSAYIALIVSFGISAMSKDLYSHHLISVQLTEINHFLILVFGLAIIMYYIRLHILLK